MALSRNAKPVSNLHFDNIFTFSFDLCEDEDYKKVEQFIQNEWTHVDILINNAGMLLNKPFAETRFIFNFIEYSYNKQTSVTIDNDNIVTISRKDNNNITEIQLHFISK